MKLTGIGQPDHLATFEWGPGMFTSLKVHKKEGILRAKSSNT